MVYLHDQGSKCFEPLRNLILRNDLYVIIKFQRSFNEKTRFLTIFSAFTANFLFFESTES